MIEVLDEIASKKPRMRPKEKALADGNRDDHNFRDKDKV